MKDKNHKRPKVVIVGAGFGGLEAAKQLKKADVDIILIDRLNHHLFQPLLYQVASAALSPGDIASPVRQIIYDQKNCSFIMATVVSIDKEKRSIALSDGDEIAYDYLILAPGSRHSYFGQNEWEEFAPGLKTIQDAVWIREKILSSFEMAERAETQEEAEPFLHFVVVGGGPTGVELAGALAEIAFTSMIHNFRNIKPEWAKIFLIEAAPHILPSFPPSLQMKAEKMLSKLGVNLLLDTKVINITDKGVATEGSFISCKTILWAAGNQASPLLETLRTPLDKQGRALVEPDLSLPGHPEIFVIGDAANSKDSQGVSHPALAPVAKQAGAFVGKLIKKNVAKEKRPRFRYLDKGSIATIGRGKAVGVIGKLKLSGFFAWFAWATVHIFYLIGFRRRLLVLIEWMAYYFTGKRTVQLITHPLDYEKEPSHEEEPIS